MSTGAGLVPGDSGRNQAAATDTCMCAYAQYNTIGYIRVIAPIQYATMHAEREMYMRTACTREFSNMCMYAYSLSPSVSPSVSLSTYIYIYIYIYIHI